MCLNALLAYLYVHHGHEGARGIQKKELYPLDLVMHGCKPPEVGCGNQTQVLCESRKCL